MLRIYKEDEVREVNNIDASAWIKNGWSLKPPDSGDKEVVNEHGVTVEESFMATPPPTQTQAVAGSEPSSNLININKAESEEIASLPGIGSRTASTLIANRPYSAIADLQKILPKINWESLQDKITF